ncbi:MAG: hypothetical protein GKR91_11525 [Pseudomonadales bacterium]|nr:hypothetical protein [Pseudomonadales bacterium]
MNSEIGYTVSGSQFSLPLLVVIVYFTIFYLLFNFVKNHISKNQHKISSLFLDTVRIIVHRNRMGFKQFRQQRFKSLFKSFLTDKEFQIRLLQVGIQASLIVLAMILLLGLVLTLAI